MLTGALLSVWSRITRKDDFTDKFKLLHADGDCSKQFLGGRGGVATAGMICVFTPAGVMVGMKVLSTAESVYDVVDFVRWMKVGILCILLSRQCL